MRAGYSGFAPLAGHDEACEIPRAASLDNRRRDRPGDVDASVEYATDLAERTGEGNTYGLGGLGPSRPAYTVSGLLEMRDNERGAGVTESLNW
jgi:hypothetical protein